MATGCYRGRIATQITIYPYVSTYHTRLPRKYPCPWNTLHVNLSERVNGDEFLIKKKTQDHDQFFLLCQNVCN